MEIFQQQGYDLMGAAFEVYNELGYGFLEEVYQEALEIELSLRKIKFSSQENLGVYYKDQKLRKRYLADLIVDGEIVVELKAVKELAPEHEAQLFNYLKATRKPVGYLINFGCPNELQWKRFIK